MPELTKLSQVPWGHKFRLPGNKHTMTHDRGDTLWSWVSWEDKAGRQEGKLYIGEEVLYDPDQTPRVQAEGAPQEE